MEPVKWAGLVAQYWPKNQWVTAVAVIGGESEWDERNFNGKAPDLSYGGFMVNMYGRLGPERRKRYKLKANEDLFDPAINVRVAWDIYVQAGGWRPWGAYTSGGYKKYGRWEKAQKAVDDYIMSWTLAPCLKQMFKEANTIAPNRNKASDGSIGDAAHSGTVSDHNPSNGIVHAIDITHDPSGGFDSWVYAEKLRLSRDRRIKYLISQGKFCRSYDKPGIPAWTWSREKDWGHYAHVHVSINSGSEVENDVSPWFEEEDELTPADKEWMDERMKFWALRAVAFVVTGLDNGGYTRKKDWTRPETKTLNETLENLKQDLQSG